MEVTDEQIQAGVLNAIAAYGRCAICGSEDNDWHKQQPHGWEDADLVAAFKAGATESEVESEE